MVMQRVDIERFAAESARAEIAQKRFVLGVAWIAGMIILALVVWGLRMIIDMKI